MNAIHETKKRLKRFLDGLRRSNLLILLVAGEGLEPPTRGLWFRCSNHLSYPATGFWTIAQHYISNARAYKECAGVLSTKKHPLWQGFWCLRSCRVSVWSWWTTIVACINMRILPVPINNTDNFCIAINWLLKCTPGWIWISEFGLKYLSGWSSNG